MSVTFKPTACYSKQHYLKGLDVDETQGGWIWIFPSGTSTITMLLSHCNYRALALIPLLLARETVANSARQNAQTALNALQEWYNPKTGLWNTCGWWNGANCMTVIADLAAVDSSVMNTATYVFSNTFSNAPSSNPHPGPEQRTVSSLSDHASNAVNASEWLDSAYDDDGWWALAWIAAYDVTMHEPYLNLAEDIFSSLVSLPWPLGLDPQSDILTGFQTTAWGTRCGNGGIPWNPSGTYVNAITNELFLSVAAHLANRIPQRKQYYVDWATMEWDWFVAQGFIGRNGTINDGLLNNCQNNGATV